MAVFKKAVFLSGVTFILTLAGCASTPPLIRAVETGNLDSVNNLLATGASPNTFYYCPALYYAARDGYDKIVASLLEKGGDPNGVCNGGVTPLLIAVKNNADPELVELLLDSGADVFATTNNGWTALMVASRYNEHDVVELLLDSGSDAFAKTVYGWTALMIASRYNEHDVVALLLEAGANLEAVSDDGFTALHLAIVADNASVVELLLSKGADATTLSEDKSIYVQANDRDNKAVTEAFLREKVAYYVSLNKASAVAKFVAPARSNTVRLAQLRELEAGVSKPILRDKYLLALSSALKQRNFQSALVYAELLDDLGLPVDDSLYFFWGESLLETNQPSEALEKLNSYLQRVGVSGIYYPQALEMMLDAEQMLDLQPKVAETPLKKQELAALEATLPPSIRRDKLMAQLSRDLEQQNYEQALLIFPKLEQLTVEVDPSLKFFHGEALLGTGNTNEALSKLYEYVSEQGSNAKHYAQALTLINKAESQL
ncbi:ankyrin repeat domain-containing protein [Marinomonas sp. C2222]|uniref:Ankyrin repeat domain-containing protein n=1 Tax=Marinomonas sargassi TaxID=2984494 RepID=A0ABT2YUH8_9GAMM|nr:ankyrin repeat domain-containing protein [Marinomonas sargassi]MCV2403554.1 ankyrin repeat domain-containing protein [Marinomonas sargassi]